VPTPKRTTIPHKSADVVDAWRCRELLAGSDGLLDWVPKLYPRYERPEHLRPVADVFARASIGGVRAVVNAPVRHGKTVLLMTAIVRHLCLKPDEWIFLVSHGSESAEFRGREIRQHAERAGLMLAEDTKRAGRWQTSQGGGLLSLGIGSGGATGFGCHVLYCDDLFPSREAAESELIRESTYQTLQGTFLSRLEPEASAIVCGARWHLDDVAGRLLADEGTRWEHVNLPAVDGEGNPLWPARWPLVTLEERRRTLGEYEWSSLWQGSPRARGSTLFVRPQSYTAEEVEPFVGGRREPWRNEIAEDKARSMAYLAHELPPIPPRIVVGVDPAAGLKQRNDYSAIAVLVLDNCGPQTRGRLLEVWRDRVELPGLCTQIRRLQRKWGASQVAVEAVAGFKGVPQSLRALDASLNVLEIQPKGDKYTRAQPLAAAVADGRFRVPEGAPWLQAFVDELLAFPVGRHDDQVDAVGLAFNLRALVRSIPCGPRIGWLRDLGVPVFL
jgi:predicted phage terminase large subunit-like protein